jgi:hypothetical protein
MSKKTLQFLRPVGASVPGGPFIKDGTYEVDDAVLNHPLIRGLLSSGEIRMLGYLDDIASNETARSLKKQLAEAKKRIAELEEKIAGLEAAAAPKGAKGKAEEKGKDAPEKKFNPVE